MNPLNLPSKSSSNCRRMGPRVPCATYSPARTGCGLYRGLGTTVAGNATSWGCLFLCRLPESEPANLQLQSAQAPCDCQRARPTPVGFPIPALFPRSKFASFSFLPTLTPVPHPNSLLRQGAVTAILTQSEMGCKGPDVHRVAQLARCAPRALECVRHPLWFRLC
jgi:hypothetical protein